MTATVDTDVTSFKTKNPTWPNLKFTTPISYMPLSPNLVFDGQHGPTTQIPTQRTSKPKATARQKSSELSGRSLEEENQKISSNPQKYQLHLSDGLSEEEDEDENNENEANLFLEHLQEIHGDIHHHHLQQQEKSYGKSLDGGPGKRHDALIYPVAALDTKRETSKCSNSKERMKAGSNQASSKLKLKKAKGDLVEVHGGRIVRSTGRKDRHSKVCTTRGLRDRRVRLSPNTAIQFYDVQDRLGYDRPSKAIDWLMKEAKSAIDELFDSSYAAKLNSTVLMQSLDRLPESSFHQQQNYHESSKPVCEVQSQDFMNDISDSTCSFFSMLNGVIPPSATDLFHTYSQGNRSQAQGLCHCFQDLSFPCGDGGQHGMLPTGSTSLHVESNQKIFSWNANSSNAIGGEEFLNNSLPLHLPYQHQLPYQREPLQSSFSPSFQAPLNDRLPNLNYACLKYSNDGLLELSAAARILGDEQENQISSEPSSATSLLHFQN